MMRKPGLLLTGVMLFVLAACGTRNIQTAPATLSPSPDAISSEANGTSTAAPTFSPVLSATAAPVAKISYWLDPNLPAALRGGIQAGPAAQSVERAEGANLRVSLAIGSTPREKELLRWTYVLAARFPNLDDSINLESLKAVWKGGDQEGHHILLAAETQKVFAALWGPPSAQSVVVLKPSELLDAAWKDSLAWAILPFEEIEPRWKVLKVNNLDPFERTMDVASYPLAVALVAESDNPALLEQAGQYLSLPQANRDPSKIVTLAMTGTTALVRKTAEMMNTKGVQYPAKDIGAFLNSADLTHISNEVSFNQDCPPARAASPEGIFCSAPAYIQLLDAVGTDIVELTGNHNLDKGVDAYRYTFGLFEQRKWGTYGGGLTLEQARLPLLVTRGETKLAFLGCNMAGPDEAWAKANQPGAATCDITALEKQVTQLKSTGVLPIVTFQAFETEDYMPAPMQRPTDFRSLAQAGAVIVSGSQSHFPQGYAFEPGSLIHYGLGNLFFDQVAPETIRRSFIDWHVFYDGKYLGAEVVTIWLEEYGKPRLMTADERRLFLKDVFKAEGW
jgi:hypothetical protein